MNMDKKKIVIISVIVVIIVLLVGCMVFLFGKKTNEVKIKSDLLSLGEKYYEDYYYVALSNSADERNSILSSYTDIGIKIDLENLSRYNNGEFKETIDTFVNKKTKQKCDMEKTKVIIYPKSPYGKTDYEMKVELDCGFGKQK